MSQRLLIFGTGRFYNNRKQKLREIVGSDKIVGFIDNRAEEIRSCDNLEVYLPQEVLSIGFDRIILMSLASEEMRDQLLSLGVFPEKITTWDDYLKIKQHGSITIYAGESQKSDGERVLIITDELRYNGGCFAAIYAASALLEKGYQVFLSTRYVENTLISEITGRGICLLILPMLPDIEAEEISLIRLFDYVLLNTFILAPVALKINGIRPVLWWIHEPELFYHPPLNKFRKLSNNESIRRIKVCAVSDVAKNNYNEYFCDIIHDLLPYGIPDLADKCKEKKRIANEKVIFAIIGTVDKRKSQDFLLDAIENLSIDYRNKSEYWIIGPIWDNPYCDNIRKKVSSFDNVKILGQQQRKEMNMLFQKIDALICCSKEDPLPIVVTEGMMYGKPCIISDVIGTRKYVKDGISCLLYKSGNLGSLADRIRWIIDNPEMRENIGNEARKIYEKSFTINTFGSRIEALFDEAIKVYEKE